MLGVGIERRARNARKFAEALAAIVGEFAEALAAIVGEAAGPKGLGLFSCWRFFFFLLGLLLGIVRELLRVSWGFSWIIESYLGI